MKIAIYGYGNLGRGVELAIRQNPDMELFGVFTRRNPASVKTLTGAAVYPAADVEQYTGDIDALIICGGSATDLPEMTPYGRPLSTIPKITCGRTGSPET